uniref:tRNA (cytosine(32)/uridine(32)-2'-O)-methyltransferase TrmJ n=1 Tax=Ningiella ruwaisensis TaxID=2364274 RepID=UPI00109F7852|nr:tRNA (cytosine(32)/uridine(32)-2'-O)-methyltransferase TrmJ [Ningiella ruwaisensis]
MLDAIRIVLVSTSHTGNIGSTARAMKTMGLSSLYLVSPKSPPDGKSSALAAGAGDVLANVTIVDSLDEAIGDCGLVIGTSMRTKTLSWPMLSTRETAFKACEEATKHSVALVFGRESNGLSNDELRKCDFHTFIPANPEYSSLNLAQAVQTFCYEIRMRFLDIQNESLPQTPVADYPLAEDLARFYEHLESSLLKTRFIRKNHPGAVMDKLIRLFNRARPEALELNILRGILASIDKQHAKMTKFERQLKASSQAVSSQAVSSQVVSIKPHKDPKG